MNILVIGGGGREHALVWKLKQSRGVGRIFCAPGNAGTDELAENVPLSVSDLPALTRFAKQNDVGLTVVGPDDPLAAGIVDLSTREGLRIFGPTKSAARLEWSKIFAKELMRRNGIPTAEAGTFDRSEDAIKFCHRLKLPLVIKADGLALGKGVVIAHDMAEAVAAIDSMLNQRAFGDAGSRIVVEEFLLGWECSLHAIVSGSSYRMMATARDHKRAYDGNLGPNTGGMGAFSPADKWGTKLQSQFEQKIMSPLLSALKTDGVEFRGLLFPGLMITGNTVRVLEFNCRFGDPETQVILPRLKSDLLELLNASVDGRLDAVTLEWDNRAAVTVVLASAGYPGKYETGKEVRGLDECASLSDVQVFHAGTRRLGDKVVTNGGRVLAVTALGATIAAARERAYDAVGRIDFEGCHFRRDIALDAVEVKVGAQ